MTGTTDGIQLVYPSSPSACSRGGDLSSEINIYCNRLEEGRVSAINMRGCVLSIDFQSVHGCGSTINYPSPTPMPSPTPRPTPTPLPPSNGAAHQLILGMDQIGFGYNALASNHESAPLIYPIFDAYTYYKENTWNSSQLYSIPDQVHIIRGQNFGIKSDIYRSVSDLMTEDTWNFGLEVAFEVPDDVGKIPVVIGDNISQLDAEMKAKNGVLGVAREKIPLYSLRLFPQQTYNSAFVSAVHGLPTTFNPSNQADLSKFETFLSDYGTHLQIGVEMGGEFGVYDVFDSTKRASFSDVELQINIKVSFLHFKFQPGFQSFSGINKVPSGISPITNPRTYSVGGDRNLATSIMYDSTQPAYKNWMLSVNSKPAPIGRQLRSMYSVMTSINSYTAESYREFLSYKNKATTFTAPVQTGILRPENIVSSGTSYPWCSLTLYYDADDDCYDGAWVVESNTRTITNTTRKPMPIDWASYPNSIGYTPSAHSAFAEVPDPELQSSSPETAPALVCGDYLCLPGLDIIGSGIDGTTGQSRLPIFDWTFNSHQNRFYNEYNYETYAFPDQVLVHPEYSIVASQPVSKTFYSTQQYVDSESDSSNDHDRIPFYSHSTETQEVNNFFEKGISILSVTEQHYDYYSITVNDQFHPISQAFNHSVEALPSTYSEKEYSDFLLYWGTHVVMSSSFGGKARLWASIDQSYYFSKQNTSINQNMGIQFGHWGAGAAYGASSNTNDFQFSEHSFQWITFYGGNGSLALTNQWAAWANSTVFYPAALSKTLVPIQNFIVDSAKAANVEKAVNAYFNKSAPAFEKPIDPFKSIVLTPTSVASTSTLLNSYGSSCFHDHDLFWADKDTFAIGQHFLSVSFSSARPDYAPSPAIYTGNCQTVYGSSCPSGYWIKQTSKFPYLACESDGCSGNYLYGSPLTCCQLLF